MPAGAVIGKGGQNIKMLQQRSGAKMSVSYSGTEVTISGSSAAVQAAAGLLRQQIETFLTSDEEQLLQHNLVAVYPNAMC